MNSIVPAIIPLQTLPPHSDRVNTVLLYVAPSIACEQNATVVNKGKIL